MDQLLTVNQLCEKLNTTRRNIELLRRKGLPYYMLGTSPRFDMKAVISWMEKNRIEEELKKHDYIFK